MNKKESFSSQKTTKYLNTKIKLSETESFTSFNSNNFSTNEKEDNSTLMNNLIDKIIKYQTENDGKTREEEISFQIKNNLFEINKKIYNIKDGRNNTFLHLLAENSKIYPLKIICDTYYFILDEENLFFKWFLSENIDNMTVLDIASIKGNKQVLLYLYSILIKTDKSQLMFDDVKNRKNTIFHYSAKHNQYYSILFWYEKLQKLFPNLRIFDTKNAHNMTPLHYACFENNFECAQLLIDLGSDINAVDINGKSILTYAINSKNIKLIEFLIINGADCNKKDSEGKTAYNYSVDVCSKSIQLLLNKNYKNILIINNKNIYEIVLLLFLLLFYLLFFASRFIDVKNFGYLLNTNMNNNSIYIILGLIFLGISFLFIIISLLFISYFSCCIKHKQHLKRKKPNLLELYDKYNIDICIKCFRRKKENTYHCNICNLCIEKWKFHSFWLNTCITKDIIGKYIIFVVSIIILLLSNITSEIFFLIFSFLDKTEYKNNNNLFNNFFYIYNNGNQKENREIKNKYFIPLFCGLICFNIFVIVKIILNYYNNKKIKNKNNILIDNHNYNNLNFSLINEDDQENNDPVPSSVAASIGD